MRITSSNEHVAAIDSTGTIMALSFGEADIRYEASDNGKAYTLLHVKVFSATDSVRLETIKKVLVTGQHFKPSVSVYPAQANPGLKVISLNEKVATVDSTGTVTAIGTGEANIRYEAYDNSKVYATLHITVYTPTDSITLGETRKELIIGQSFQPQTKIYPVTAFQKLKIYSSNEKVTTVDSTGTVKAIGPGDAVIRYEAYDNSEVFALLQVKVYARPDSIRISNRQITLTVSDTYRATTSVFPSTASQKVRYSSSNTKVATVDTTGLVKAVAPGETYVRYEAYNNSEVFALLKVRVYAKTDSVKLSKNQIELITNSTYKPEITVFPATASRKITMTTSNPQVATVDSTGTITAIAPGEADIRYEAFDNSEVFALLHIKVFAHTDSIKLSNTQTVLIVGQEFKPTISIYPAQASQQFKVSSSNVNVAIVDTLGKVSAVGPGKATIRYESYDNKEVFAQLQVKVYAKTESIILNNSQIDLLVNKSYKSKITVVPSTANQELKMTTSNPQVATVDSTGTITAITPGDADIRYEAFDNSEVFATLHVKVYALAETIQLSDKELHLLVDAHYGNVKVNVLPATAKQEWLMSSNNTSVAFVNEENEIVAKGWGECDIIYETTDGTKKMAKCHVYVTVPTDSLKLKTTVLNTNPGEVFKAQQVNYYPEHSRLDLNYSSSNEQVATVDSQTGAITAVAVGEADVRYEAKDGTGKYAVCHVKVWPRTVSITPSTKTMSLKVGEKYDQQTVEVLPAGAYPKLKLTSEDKSVATVDEKGAINAVSPGVTNILYQAMDSSKIVAKCRVIVYAKNVVYVGGIYYKLTDETTTDDGRKIPAYATVTSIYGGENKGDDASKIAQFYSGTINIPKSVTYNGKTYPVTEVGSYSFYCQNSLQSIYIPSSVESVSSNAAMFSTSLQLVTVEDGSQLVNIGREAFKKCTGLLRFTFNGTTLKMKSIDPSAFSECTALQRVRWKGESTLTMIDDYAFYRCSSLNHMEMPNAVVRIGKHAFRYNTSLTDVKLAKRLSMIDEYAFGECGFSHITLPDSIASAQAGAFINNEHLETITIPADMEGIGAACFENCAVLDSVTFLTNIHTLTIGNNAFNLCPALKRVNIAHLDSWAETNFNNAKANPANTAHHIYKDGKEVLDVVLPKGTLYVNNNAFNGCSYIKSVDMPSSIDHINDDIFVGCDSLKAVYCRAEDVPLFIGVNDPSAMSDVFNRATLYVPFGYESDYKADTWWGRFYKIQGFDASTGISNIILYNDGKTRYYDLNGRLIGSRPTIQGVYIKVENGKRTKVTIE